jgi:hypothetical protein
MRLAVRLSSLSPFMLGARGGLAVLGCTGDDSACALSADGTIQMTAYTLPAD